MAPRIVEIGSQYDYFQTSLQGLWAPSQRIGLYDTPALLKDLAHDREEHAGPLPSPRLATCKPSVHQDRPGPVRVQSSSNLRRRRPLYEEQPEQLKVYWKSSTVPRKGLGSSFSAGSLSSTATASPRSPRSQYGEMEDVNWAMAGRLGMIHGLWGREKEQNRARGSEGARSRRSERMSMMAKTWHSSRRAVESPVFAASMQMSIQEDEHAKKKAEIAEKAQELIRRAKKKADDRRKPLDGFGDCALDLLERLNTLRRKGQEMVKARGDTVEEGGEDPGTLQSNIQWDTNDDEDALTEIIEELMDAQDAARETGGAKHATIHIVNRCCMAAKRKRACLEAVKAGLEEIESKSQWDRDIASFRIMLNENIHINEEPTAPNDNLTPEHTLAVRAIDFLKRAMDERGKAIIEYGTNGTDSADAIDQCIKDALALGKVKLIPSIAPQLALFDFHKDHPQILAAKRVANGHREGERMKQRKIAADQKQKELKLKQEAELRAKQQVVQKEVERKKSISLLRASVNMVRLSLRHSQGGAAAGGGQ